MADLQQNGGKGLARAIEVLTTKDHGRLASLRRLADSCASDCAWQDNSSAGSMRRFPSQRQWKDSHW